MLTVAPHLHTRRPSPTTIEYTVSTAPPPTLSHRLLLAASFLIRLVLGVSALLLLHSKWHLSVYSSPLPSPTSTRSHSSPDDSPIPFLSTETTARLLADLQSSALGHLSSRLAARVPAPLLVPLSILTIYLVTIRLHTTESLLVLRGLGIQTSTSSATYMSTATTRFIPTEKILDILVNEAFRGFEVRYYLVVVVEGEEEVVVVFPRLLPRRAIVERVWRGARGCLWEPENGKREVKEEEGQKG